MNRSGSQMLTWAFIIVALVGAATAIFILVSGVTREPPQTSSIPPRPTNTGLALNPPQGQLVFDQNFDDGLATGIQPDSPTKWEVIDDNIGGKVFQVNNSLGADWTGFSLGATTIADGTIEYKVKLVDYDLALHPSAGAVACHFRSTLQNRYVYGWHVDQNTLTLDYQGTDSNNEWKILGNAVVPFMFNKNTWYDARVDFKGGEITAYLDGRRLLTATDNRLRQGEINFGVDFYTVAQFDDIRVWEQP